MIRKLQVITTSFILNMYSVRHDDTSPKCVTEKRHTRQVLKQATNMASKNTHRHDVSAFFINQPMARLIRKREKVSAFIAFTPVLGLAWRFSVCWALPGVSAIRPFIGWSHPREVCQENKSRLLREKIMDEAGESGRSFCYSYGDHSPYFGTFET